MAHMHVVTTTDYRKATIVEVEFVLDDGRFWVGSGSSFKSPGDVYDPDLGELIAGTRALDTLLNHSGRGLKLAVKRGIRDVAVHS